LEVRHCGAGTHETGFRSKTPPSHLSCFARKGKTKRHTYYFASIDLTGILLVGCEKEAEKRVPKAPEGAVGGVKQPEPPAAAKEAPAKAPVPAEAAPKVEQAAEKVEQAAEKAKEAVSETATKVEKEAKAAAPATATAASVGEAAVKEAQSQLSKVLEATKGGKLDIAEQLLGALEAKAGSLPAPLPENIAKARKALEVAKLANAAKSLIPKDTSK